MISKYLLKTRQCSQCGLFVYIVDIKVHFNSNPSISGTELWSVWTWYSTSFQLFWVEIGVFSGLHWWNTDHSVGVLAWGNSARVKNQGQSFRPCLGQYAFEKYMEQQKNDKEWPYPFYWSTALSGAFEHFSYMFLVSSFSWPLVRSQSETSSRILPEYTFSGDTNTSNLNF